MSAGWLLVVGLLASACSFTPDAAESEEIAESMRVDVRDTISTVVAGLREQGIEVEDPTGSFGSCGMKDPALEFGAGALTSPESGPMAEQIAIATEVIESLGIPMDQERPLYVSTDPTESDIRVSAQESRPNPGSLIIEVVRDCEELDAGVVDARLHEDGDTLGYQG